MPAKNPAPSLAPIDLNQAYSVAESCQYFRCSRSYFYKMLEAGLFSVIRRGARTFVAGAEIAKMSQAQTREQAAATAQALRSVRPQTAGAQSPDTPRRGRGRPRTRPPGESPPAPRS